METGIDSRLWLRASCELVFEISIPVSMLLMLRPRSGAQQWVAREEYDIRPSVPAEEITDSYGNLCQRLVAPAGDFSIRTTSEVVTADSMDVAPGAAFVEIQQLPADVLPFLLPSRYCESDRFDNLALQIAGDRKPGYDQVVALVEWVKEHVAYRPGTSSTPLSAIEINRNQHGVCRDLNHLAITLCRSICIPARMVVGYLYGLEPMDLHAWFEAYVGGRWYLFDATQDGPKGGYVAIAYGRDATDVAIYTQHGPPVYPTRQKISVERLDRPR